MTLEREVRTAPPVRRMRAVVLEGFGDAGRLRLEPRAPVPTRVMGEVLVRVAAAGVNPIDVATRAGAGAAAGIASWPAVLGCDFSGTVEEAPYEAFGLLPGDEVFGTTAFPRGSGSWAEYAAVPATSLTRKPRVLSHVEAAAVPTAALTAWGAVVQLAKAHEGQRILVHAGAGGVGHLAVQIAAYFGAHVIATGSGRNAAWLRQLGAVETVDYTAERFEQVVEPVDAVIDLVGASADRTGPRSLGVLRPGGLLVTLPSAGWPTLAADAARAGVRATSYRVCPDAAVLAVVARLIDSGDLRVTVQDVLPLESVAQALEAVEAGHVRGKVVLRIDDH